MKVLIVDDHPVLRDGFSALLRHADPDNTVLQARDANEGLAFAESVADLDVIILDLEMPGMKGFQALAEFGRRRPDVPVIVLSSSEDPHDVRQSLALGALGYVPKSASQTVLLSAIGLVLDGDIYVPPLVLIEDAHLARGRPPNEKPESNQGLTTRQLQILGLLSDGLPNKTIAARLGLSEKTVKVHITAIFKALKVVNRTQAAAAGRKAGII